MRTTITIPEDLAAQADALIGLNGIITRNQLIVEALQHWIELKQEEAIDAEFASMAEDEDYIIKTLAIKKNLLKAIAKSHLSNKLGKVNTQDIKEIDRALKIVLSLN